MIKSPIFSTSLLNTGGLATSISDPVLDPATAAAAVNNA